MAEINDDSSNSATKQSMVRLDIYVKRHPSLNSAEFHEFVGTFFLPLITINQREILGVGPKYTVL